MENTDEVVEHAVNALSLAGWSLGGALIGFVAALVLALILQLTGHKSELALRILRRTRVAQCAALTAFGAWMAYQIDVPAENADDAWYSGFSHILLLAMILCLGWYFYSLAGVIQDAAKIRTAKDTRDAKRIQTQAQVLQRVAHITVVIVTIIMCLLTFPGARAPMAALLSSAGILSVVAGLAAQSTLGNMFAGIQLAFTDAIRVGDTITTMMGSKEETGTIEEVTLTYVVMRIWNERRVLLPSSEFTSKPFENWTRRGTDQLGTVELSFDWPVPMAQIRHQTQKILMASDLWDQRTWNVQMTGSQGTSVTVRIVVSAGNPGDRWDLECEVREKMMAWVTEEIPWALPRVRNVPEEVHKVNRDVSDQKVAELAEELSGIADTSTDGNSMATPGVPPAASRNLPPISAPETAPADDDPIHAARLRASRQKAKRARRRSILGRKVPKKVEEPTSLDATQVMTSPMLFAEELKKNGDDSQGTRLYSGSPDAEQRRHLWDGPGEEVLRQREETAIMQALDAKGEAVPPAPPSGDDQDDKNKGGHHD